MSTPNEIVVEQFSQAQSYVTDALASMEEFLTDFRGLTYTNPTVDIEWADVIAPDAVTIPTRPTALDEIEDEFTWNSTMIDAAKPVALDIEEPEISISDFTEEAPELDLSGQPELAFPDAPTIVIGDVPEVPEVADIDIPEAPTIADVEVPTLLELVTPTFAGIDLHTDILDELTSVEVLELAAPTPYEYTPGDAYSSTLLDKIKTNLQDRLDGGTGLDPAVEAALWDRTRDRSTQELEQNYDQVDAGAANLGWHLPTGNLVAARRRAREAVRKASAAASRDIAIKQADLEQSNLRDAISAGIQLESKLIDYSYQLEDLTFRAAVELAQNAIAVHNAQVEKFRVDLQRFDVLAKAYDTIMRGELAKIEVLRADIALEQAKADFNRALVAQMQAQVDAGLATVKVYEALIGGTKTRIELEGVKINAAGERIRGFVAQMNAKTAIVEVYKAGVQAEGVKQEAWATNIKGQLGTTEIYRAKADAFRAKSGAEGEKSRALLERFRALHDAKASEWRGYVALVDGERARVTSVGQKADAVLSGWKAELQAVEATVSQNIQYWGGQIKQYEAQKTYTLAGEKLNADILQSNRQVLLDASKVAAQIHAQVVGSALSVIRTSADVRASSSMNIQYGYTGKTNATVDPVTSV